MKLFFTGLLTLSIYTSCQSTSSQTAQDIDQILETSELHCIILLPNQENKAMSIEARFPESAKGSSILTLKQTGRDEIKTISVPISSSGMIDFEVSKNERLGISLVGKPRVGRISGSFDESSAMPCVQLIKNTKVAVAVKPASCKASGTPAQGWYQAGRIIQHSHSCSHEVLSCGAAPIPGWYVQQKIQRSLVKGENCGWMKKTPVCRSSESVTGWFFDDRLVAKDEKCFNKEIECRSAETNQEGWYVYERSSPQLLVTESCNSNRNISYLAH
jgi:hypothetical protein